MLRLSRRYVTVGSVAPDFTSKSSHGLLNLHEYLGNSWGVVLSQAHDIVPVRSSELYNRDLKIVALTSKLKESSHLPLVLDESNKIGSIYGFEPPKELLGSPVNSTKGILIGPDKRVRKIISFTDRSMKTVLNEIDDILLMNQSKDCHLPNDSVSPRSSFNDFPPCT